MKTRFFSFDQNNSGGSFDIRPEDGIGEYVIVEALDVNHANQRAEQIGIYFDGCDNGMDCNCCGDRWSRAWDDEGDPEPMIYGTPVDKAERSMFRDTAFIHYLEGPFKTVKLKDRINP